MPDTVIPPHLLDRAAAVLADALGGPVRLGEPYVISEAGRRHLILRLPLADAPDDAPAAVIVKQTADAGGRPHDSDASGPLAVANEHAGLTFAAGLGLAIGPRSLGADPAAGFVLLEDLGDAPGVDHALLHGPADAAATRLLAMARGLGRLHAASAGRAARIRELRAAMGVDKVIPADVLRGQLQETIGRSLDFVATVGAELGEGTRADMEAIIEVIVDPAEFEVFTHSDPCPENARVDAGGQMRLLDFEYASVGHALLDAAFARMHFPTCWCSRAIPDELLDRIDAAHREELAAGVPATLDDERYTRELVEACGFWTMVGWIFSRDRSVWYEDIGHGTASVRQRIIARTESFAALSERTGHLPAFGALCRRMVQGMRESWPGISPMPLYPAFGGPPAGQ